jgi:prepilin-type N-terminal cleavage/methylation domain-containing protein
VFLRVSFALWQYSPGFFALVAMVAFIRNNRTSRSSIARPGFTLLEVLVVLILLGVGFGLAVPAFATHEDDGADGVQRILSTARRAAVRRAEAITVSIAPSGDWMIDNGDRAATPQTGTLDWQPGAHMRVRISPLGACVLDTNDASLSIDAVSCRIFRRAAT